MTNKIETSIGDFYIHDEDLSVRRDRMYASKLVGTNEKGEKSGSIMEEYVDRSSLLMCIWIKKVVLKKDITVEGEDFVPRKYDAGTYYDPTFINDIIGGLTSKEQEEVISKPAEYFKKKITPKKSKKKSKKKKRA